ncbi:ABC transporter ATP-binding protein [Pelosinus fermentans]|uniref:Xenobiotic-transporting ATPase n=1 Tax=Pelosinus fermentans JBW45 TaxID=1192197 RepID=I9DGJ3_9FIRM|nr:ABC transporter ATP-binding protein [Pelosinus fermentans]AJQ26607.1 Xenobiotic-transporting ATPase [Pelosinus fermentans JBW45]
MKKLLTENIRIFQEIKPFIKNYERQLIILSINKLLQLPIGIAMLFLFKELIDEVMNRKQLDILRWICIGYILLFFLQTLFLSYQKIVGTKMYNKLIFDIRLKIWNSCIRMPQDSWKSFDKGDLKNRIDSDVNSFSIFLEQQIFENAFAWISIFTYGFILLIICWKLALFSFGIIPMFFLLGNWIAARQKEASEDYRNIWGEYEGWMFNCFQAWKEVKNLSIEKVQTKKFVRYWRKLIKLFYRQCMYMYASMSFDNFKDIFINKISIYFLGGILIYTNELTIGQLLIFTKFYEQMFNNCSTVSNLYIQLGTNLPAMERVLEIMKYNTRYQGIKLDQNNFSSSIEFRNVGFTYSEGQPEILKNINLKIEANERIAIIGKSGSGKSTILKLLLGLHKPQQGEILINGYPIEEINYSSLHRIIGVVMQDNMVFNLTIKDNLLLANPYATDAEIKDACKTAYIDKFITALPNGYLTLIGENGVKLSGGQKQRLGIARALLTNPNVIVFDEATSALDHISEQEITMAIDNIAKKKIIIVIAHRLSSILSADQVIVIDNGTIAGYGHHSELLGKNSAYDVLFKDQYKNIAF